MMNDGTRKLLSDLVHQFGLSVIEDAKRCEGLIRDFLAEHRKETNVLIAALQERVPTEILNVSDSIPMRVLLSRLARQLQDSRALHEEAARWAVTSWAFALGKIGPASQSAANIVPEWMAFHRSPITNFVTWRTLRFEQILACFKPFVDITSAEPWPCYPGSVRVRGTSHVRPDMMVILYFPADFNPDDDDSRLILYLEENEEGWHTELTIATVLASLPDLVSKGMWE